MSESKSPEVAGASEAPEVKPTESLDSQHQAEASQKPEQVESAQKPETVSPETPDPTDRISDRLKTIALAVLLCALLAAAVTYVVVESKQDHPSIMKDAMTSTSSTFLPTSTI